MHNSEGGRPATGEMMARTTRFSGSPADDICVLTRRRRFIRYVLVASRTTSRLTAYASR